MLSKNYIDEIIKKFEKIPNFKTHYRVAISGLSGSGKSVFLTSLINQFLANDKLDITNSKEFVARLKEVNLPIKNFPYKEYLEEFRNKSPNWPLSTTGISGFSIEIEIQNRYKFIENKIVVLEFIDYPGEWLIDLPMVNKSFEKWSSEILDLSLRDDKKEYSKDFHQSLFNLEEQNVIKEYKKYLFNLKKQNFSFIQPAHFVEKGKFTYEDLSFTPLPYSAKDSPIYKKFEKRYNFFIKNLLKSFDKPYYKDYDKQIILVDLVKSLQNGYDCFEDMYLAIKEMLSPYSYGNNTFLSRLFLKRIEEVIIVGTKADNIANNQHNNYKQLLVDMLKDIKNELKVKQIKVNSTIISSVKSTQNVKAKFQGREISCLKGILEGESEESIHYPGEIPENFYDRGSWSNREFLFPKFKPRRFPHSDKYAVAHIRMDDLIKLLIGKWL